MPDKDPCGLITGIAKKMCENDWEPEGGGSSDTGGGRITGGASEHVKHLAETLIKTLRGLLAPKRAWAPEETDNPVYQQFLWLGQHLTIAILICVIVVCALTAWQGAPRLKQLGTSTGWTLAAVAGMASVPGVVMLLNQAVSSAFTTAFDSNQSTLLETISADLDHGADSGNPVAILIIISALVVALAFASLVFMTRQLGILAFVLMAPLVLASLARGGDTSAVRAWAIRLLGLMFAPFALLLVSPFVQMVSGSLVMDAVLLVAADAVMLRMIFHGIPYFGPKVAGAARNFVESRTTNPLARAVVRAGSPDFYEQENQPRMPRTVDTPGRAAHQDRGVLYAAYGLKQKQWSSRLTTESTIDKSRREAPRNQQLVEARRAARAAAAQTITPGPRTPGRAQGRGPAVRTQAPAAPAPGLAPVRPPNP
ncbi:hypothetical protein OG784_31945 [Streptomyces sp. NBC_01617]|uniref:hypothetical protein n=1 Tax=unclassified Streptomyces TaxID=2593676 RepID=UPI003865E57F|nr:hypothetical protein OG987_32095 [Streptomyces sp. NBC_01620]WTE63061.1 hypothetical protein OG784_31945 [Streptomyces sp. NBC_01617]